MLKEIAEKIAYSGLFLDEWTFTSDMEDLLGDDVCATAGATRGVIIPEVGSLVLKMQLDGVNFDGFGTQEFCNAGSETPGYEGATDNYFEVEEYLYKKAEDAGIEYLFAKNELLCTLKGYQFYTQEKCIILSDMEDSYDEKVYKEWCKICVQHGILSKFGHIWGLKALEYFGLETMIALSSFCSRYEITDLHSGNLGFRLDGTPVIIDYAGFSEVENDVWED